MTRRIFAGLCFIGMAFFCAVPSRAQSQDAPRAAAASSRRIVTKDPDYLKLLNAPLADSFVRTYSKGYQEKSAEIEAKIAAIGDEKLRNQARLDEWAAVSKYDQDRFQYEAEVALRDAKVAFAQKHREGWLEVGHVTYVEAEQALIVRSDPTAPIETYFRVSMTGSALNQIYEKFHEVVGPEVERQAREYVAKSGANSQCARNPDWCLKIKQDDIEQGLRSMRIVAVATGDLEGEKIDRYLLVDYDTETVLADLAPKNPLLISVAWRFSIGPVPAPPLEPPHAAAAAQPAEAATSESTGAPAQNPPAPPSASPAPIKVPANITAAAILSRTTPEYPAKARAAHVQGDVILRAIIDKEGRISEVHALSGDDLLVEAAIDAVKQWRYKPMLSDGQPTDVETTITVTFSLQE